MHDTSSVIPATKIRTPMPPVKRPREAKTDDQLSERRIREITDENIDRVYLWYRRISGSGETVGLHVTMEVVFGVFKDVRRLAREGKHWTPPDMTPEAYEAQYRRAT